MPQALQTLAPDESPAPTSMETERERYRAMWGHTQYRRYSPGEDHIEIALEALRPRLGASFIDFGCGTGRPAQELRLRGYGVLAIDFADNCLDQDVDVPLLVADLTALPQISAEYGYCTDVMEHIPTERVGEVLAAIYHSIRCDTFFSISLVHDAFGPRVLGSHLHLTVRDAGWWSTELGKVWPFVEILSQEKGQLLVVGRNPPAGAGFVEGGDNVKARCNTPEEQILKNIGFNSARDGIQWLEACQAHDAHAVIVGGGASLHWQVEEVRWRQSQGQHIIALNGAAQFLKSHGITPDWLLMIDSRPGNVRFLEGFPAQAYLLGSQCDPSVFDRVEGKNVIMFHLATDGIEDVLPKGRTVTRIRGDATAGLVAMAVAYTAGYREMHLYGYDSSDAADGEAHAYPQDQTSAEQKRVTTWFEGKQYRSSFAMFSQAHQFRNVALMLAELDTTITVHGSGLLPAIAHSLARDLVNVPTKENT